MDPFETSHLSHDALLHEVKTLVARDRRTTAVLLSRLVELDERRLYLREGYPSMYAYCVQGLHLCEGTASKHINAVRAARNELLAAATHKTRAEIEQLLAQRFPRPDLPEWLQALPSPAPIPAMAPAQAPEHSPGNVAADAPASGPPVPGPGHQHSPGNVQAPASRPKMTPLAPERFGLQVTLDQETYDLLQQARALMSHQVPRGEIAPVLKSALELLVAHLEKRKFAATTHPGHSRHGTSVRSIPAAVKRAVRERDGGQCAFVSDTGQRCPARAMLEFDHIEPVARGGEATAENVRLMCRAHNQYAAERTFGSEFMSDKRADARARAAARKRAESRAAADERARGAVPPRRIDVSLVTAT